MNRLLGDLRTHVLQPGSVLVLQSKSILHADALEKAKQSCKEWKEKHGVEFPIMFLDASVDVTVIEPPPQPKVRSL